MFGHHLAPFWLQFSSLFAQSSSNSAICSAFWILQTAKTGRIITCGVLVEIPVGRKLCRILHAEFRPKSLRDSACTISSVTYAEFCMQSFGRNPRIMLRAEIRPKRQQIYGRNLHIILLQILGISLCRQQTDLYMQSVLQNLGLCLAEISFRMCPKYLQNYAYRISANISA